MWYNLALVDGFSSNSSSILEVIFFVKISSNSTIGSMRSSCQIRHLSIQIVSSIVFSNTHFRYAAYSAIYSWTLFFFFLIPFPSSWRIFSSSLMTFWTVFFFLFIAYWYWDFTYSYPVFEMHNGRFRINDYFQNLLIFFFF